MTYKDDQEFQRCMKFVLEQECRHKKDGTLDDGYVFDKNDPGGETKYGISKRAYPNVDIKNLTLDNALAIYYRDYWPCASTLDFPLNVCVFDCAVNQGTKKAMRFLMASKKDWKLYIQQRWEDYAALLAGKFKDNPDKDKFRKTWFTRLNNLKKFIDEQVQINMVD